MHILSKGYLDLLLKCGILILVLNITATIYMILFEYVY